MPNKKKIITNIEAVNSAISHCMSKDKNIITYGLGATDPGRIFGTNKNLLEMFGSKRVFDTPTSENSLIGMGIGAAMIGIRSIISSQRIDFITLAMDQIINGAAKWHFITGGRVNIPIVLRLIVGRGWGQGATHSQNFHSLFSSVPGLKIVMPTFPIDTRAILIDSIKDKNPVLFIEQRWTHNLKQNIDFKKKIKNLKIGNSKVLKKGKDITIIGQSYSTIQALNISKTLLDQGYDAEIIDLVSIVPLDVKTILESVKKTGRILVLEIGNGFTSVGSEILSIISEKIFNSLKNPPIKMSFPNSPNLSSSKVSAKLYYNEIDILSNIKKSFFKNLKINKNLKIKYNIYPDIPDKKFNGPF